MAVEPSESVLVEVADPSSLGRIHMPVHCSREQANDGMTRRHLDHTATQLGLGHVSVAVPVASAGPVENLIHRK